MNDTVTELRDIVASWTRRFEVVPESEWLQRPDPDKWSKKEVLGHLIDSALNNHRRFIVSQYAEDQRIVYYQNQWVFFQGYHQADVRELIALWRLLNLQIVRVLEIMPENVYGHTCDTGKDGPDIHTLEWLAVDYLGHLKHHLTQILI